jgi:hypothetical protein
MERIFPVTVSLELDRMSLELLPALTSTGPGSMTTSPERRVYASRLMGTVNVTVFDLPASR